jgi:hypothetical protein
MGEELETEKQDWSNGGSYSGQSPSPPRSLHTATCVGEKIVCLENTLNPLSVTSNADHLTPHLHLSQTSQHMCPNCNIGFCKLMLQLDHMFPWWQVVFGGQEDNSAKNDVFIFDTVAERW